MAPFFERPHTAHSSITKAQATFLHIGGDSWHALAVCLIDYFDTDKPVDESVLKTMLDQLDKYYPSLQVSQPRLSPMEHMRMLMHTVRRSELVTCLAYTLRQMTLDKLFAEPLLCPEVFMDLPNENTDAYLRQESTKLPNAVLHLIPNALGIPLTILTTEPGKECRVRTIYPADAKTEAGITLQASTKACFPEVFNKVPFTYVGQLAVKVQSPQRLEQTSLATVATAKIAQDKQEVQAAYNRYLRTLAACDLSKSDLEQLYIEWLPEDRVREAYYEALLEPENQPVSEEIMAKEPYTIKLLSQSLARWMAAELVDAEELFESLETTSSTAQSRLGG